MNKKAVFLALIAIFALFILAGIGLGRHNVTRGVGSNLCIDCMGLVPKK